MTELKHLQSLDNRSLISLTRAFARDPFEALEQWSTHDDIVRLEFPGDTFYLVSRPELIESILHDSEGRFTIAAQQQQAFADIEDHAITTTTGDRWK